MHNTEEGSSDYDYLKLSEHTYNPTEWNVPEGFEIVGKVDAQGNKYSDNFDNGYEATA